MASTNKGRHLTYNDLQNTSYMKYYSTSPATPEGELAIRQFVSEGRTRPVGGEGGIGRSLFVKAEDVAFVRETAVQILGLTRQDLGYISEKLLPTVLTKDTKIKWSTIEYKPMPMTRVPALGVSYAPEVLKSENEASAFRVGQHFEIEGDAWYTEAGQTDYQRNLVYWSVVIAETLDNVGWNAIINAGDDIRSRYFSKPALNETTYTQLVTKQRDDTFRVYKDIRAMYSFVQENCESIRIATGNSPNIMVMPAEKSALITSGTDMNTYANGGERALDMMYGQGKLTTFCNLEVYPPPTFSTRPDEDKKSPLDSAICIGSYAFHKYCTGTDADRERTFKLGECMDKLIDEPADDWAQLPDLKDSLLESGRFVQDGGNLKVWLPVGGFDEIPQSVKDDTKDPFNKYYQKSAPNKSQSAEDWVKELLGVTQKDKKYRFMTAAPLARYATQGMLIAASGPDAGITTMSEPIVTKAEDAATQKFLFALTCWMGAYIFDNRRFRLIMNVFYNGILGGTNTKFIQPAAAETLSQNSWTDNLSNSLNRDSLYFMIVGDGDVYPDFIDLRGSLQVKRDKMTYPCAAFYSWRFGFDMIADDTDEFERRPISPICFRRSLLRWNGTDYAYSAGDTHHGKNEGVGSRDMRRYGREIRAVIKSSTRD